MAHKTLVNGTSYEITGGKTLVNSTGYDINSGKTLVSGVGYDVPFGVDYADMFRTMTIGQRNGRASSSANYVYLSDSWSSAYSYYLCQFRADMGLIYVPDGTNDTRQGLFYTYAGTTSDPNSARAWVGRYNQSGFGWAWWAGSKGGWGTAYNGTLVSCNFPDYNVITQFFVDYSLLAQKAKSPNNSYPEVISIGLSSFQEGDVVFAFYDASFAISMYINGQWVALKNAGLLSSDPDTLFVYGTSQYNGTGLFLKGIDADTYGGLYLFRKN